MTNESTRRDVIHLTYLDIIGLTFQYGLAKTINFGGLCHLIYTAFSNGENWLPIPWIFLIIAGFVLTIMIPFLWYYDKGRTHYPKENLRRENWMLFKKCFITFFIRSYYISAIYRWCERYENRNPEEEVHLPEPTCLTWIKSFVWPDPSQVTITEKLQIVTISYNQNPNANVTKAPTEETLDEMKELYGKECSDVAYMNLFDLTLNGCIPLLYKIAINVANPPDTLLGMEFGFYWFAISTCMQLLLAPHTSMSYYGAIRKPTGVENFLQSKGRKFLYYLCFWLFWIAQLSAISFALAYDPFITLMVVAGVNIATFLWIKYVNPIERKYDSCFITHFMIIVNSWIYNFQYINMREGKTWKFQIAFYSVNLAKISGFSLIVYNHLWDFLVFIPVGLFALGCVLLMLYYAKFHPKLDNNDQSDDPPPYTDPTVRDEERGLFITPTILRQ